jgi:hypothetical protein
MSDDRPGTPVVELTSSQQATIRALLHDEAPIPAPTWLARQATIPNDAVERDHAHADPAGFWAERATAVDWIEPWTDVLEVDGTASRTRSAASASAGVTG